MFFDGECGQFLKYLTTAEISDKVGPDLVTDGGFARINVTYLLCDPNWRSNSES